MIRSDHCAVSAAELRQTWERREFFCTTGRRSICAQDRSRAWKRY